MATRLLVLGLLDMQPMSGYDIQQMLKMTDAERWSGVQVGSIYHALKKMEGEGLVEVTSIEQTGHRQKAVYRITEQGTEQLLGLTREALQASSVTYPSPLYAGLSFVHKLPKEEALAALDIQARSLELEYQSLEAGLEAKNGAMNGTVPPLTALTFDNMFDIVRQQQQFVSQAIQLLQSGG